ncbi:MAG: CvpA family protein [Dehalococcoidia bacterium]
MILINVITGLILVISFVDGFSGGVVKQFFSFVVFIIAIPLTGISHHLIASTLSFLPGDHWSYFVGFFITFVIFTIIFHFAFYLPKKYVLAIFHEGILLGIAGGLINTFKAIIGIVLVLLVFHAYPVIRGLEPVLIESGILTWFLNHFRFVQLLLPQTFRLISA